MPLVSNVFRITRDPRGWREEAAHTPAEENPMNSMNETRYTLKDVADRAGVAISTASLVFSGKRYVAEATRDRVLKAAADLDYGGPNPLASSLRQGRSGIIGVFAEGRLMHSFSDPFAVSILDGLAQHLGQNSSGVLLIPAQGADENEVVRRMSGIPLDAVAFPLGGHVSNAVLDHLRHRRIPLVGTGYPSMQGVLQLTMDERAAMRAIAQHLHDLGHRDVALIQLPNAAPRGDSDTTPTENPEAAERTRGFLDVFPDALVVRAAESSIEGGLAATDELFANGRPFTAIAAQSDLLAVGALRAVGERGLNSPADISISGFDGIELPWLTGTLTTIDQAGHEKGRAIGEMVSDALEGRFTERTHAFRFIEGSSTAAPPAQN